MADAEVSKAGAKVVPVPEPQSARDTAKPSEGTAKAPTIPGGGASVTQAPPPGSAS